MWCRGSRVPKRQRQRGRSSLRNDQRQQTHWWKNLAADFKQLISWIRLDGRLEKPLWWRQQIRLWGCNSNYINKRQESNESIGFCAKLFTERNLLFAHVVTELKVKLTTGILVLPNLMGSRFLFLFPYFVHSVVVFLVGVFCFRYIAITFPWQKLWETRSSRNVRHADQNMCRNNIRHCSVAQKRPAPSLCKARLDGFSQPGKLQSTIIPEMWNQSDTDAIPHWWFL